MNRIRKLIVFLLVLIIILHTFPAYTMADEDRQYRMNKSIVVDGNEVCYIPVFDNAYENNLYISLRGLAFALKGTVKAFNPIVEQKKISISTGEDYTGELYLWNDNELNSEGKASDAKYELYVNDNERKYYSFILNTSGGYDAFFNPVSISMMLDIHIEVHDGIVEIDTFKPFSISADELEEAGYFQGVNALVIGDAVTGKSFYGYCGDEIFPIASTTKLMTYFVLMDAVTQGKCSLDDSATLSEKAARLSKSSDGVVPMTAGLNVPVRELICGMLIQSSNECALAIAEHVAGSEEAFVGLMNAKAEELGLENAKFYNCHGLPDYEDQFIPAKKQNHMTANEMFTLASAIMNTYPQITEYTSVKTYYLDTLGKDIKNTNPVLYNMDSAVGLKTGTTNRAGACLVTCTARMKDGELHYLISVLLGAEEDASRGIVSELSARYAEDFLSGNDLESQDDTAQSENKIPDDPELVVEKLIKIMEKNY